MRRALGIWLFGLATACQTDAPALLVDVSSELEIPGDTNNLVIRIDADGERFEQAYTLGDAPRDRWPQTLPVVGVDSIPKRLTVAGELRVTTEGRPSVVVGYGEVEVAFPAEGIARAPLEVPRACTDADGDGFGVGFGCSDPDCDDDDPDAPRLYFCGSGPIRDGGVRDGGPVRDGGVRDGGPAPRDGGVSGTPCGDAFCAEDEMCLDAECYRSCTTNADCGAIHLGCFTRYGVCVCRLPCRDSTTCGPLECIDECCQF